MERPSDVFELWDFSGATINVNNFDKNNLRKKEC